MYHFVQGLTMSFDDIRNITFANNKGIINIDPFIADKGTHMDCYWTCRKDISKFTDTCICVKSVTCLEKKR